jgi:hypothetical protein
VTDVAVTDAAVADAAVTDVPPGFGTTAAAVPEAK